MDHLPSEMSTPAPADRRAEMSPAENALHVIDEAVATTNVTRFTIATASENFSPLTDILPSGPVLRETEQRAIFSRVEIVLHDAKEAMTTINLSKTWEGALERIKWVMDTLSPVAEVRLNDHFSNP